MALRTLWAAALLCASAVAQQCSTTAAISVVGQYLTQVYLNGDVNEAASFTTGPTFQFGWHSPKALVPFAGTVSGANALQSFYASVFSVVDATGFRLNPAYAPERSGFPDGVDVIASSCWDDTTAVRIVAQWQESGTVMSNGLRFHNATSTAIFEVVMAEGDVFAIRAVNTWPDVDAYAAAFCGSSAVPACSKSSPSLLL
jgi:hypothetical protein